MPLLSREQIKFKVGKINFDRGKEVQFEHDHLPVLSSFCTAHRETKMVRKFRKKMVVQKAKNPQTEGFSVIINLRRNLLDLLPSLTQITILTTLTSLPQ